MPRGGYRPGGGRPRGARDRVNSELIEHMAASGAADMIGQLTAVAEAPYVPAKMRLEALRRLFGWFASQAWKKATTDTSHDPASIERNTHV